MIKSKNIVINNNIVQIAIVHDYGGVEEESTKDFVINQEHERSRYDVIYEEAGELGIISGEPRIFDAVEFIPEIDHPNRKAIYHIKITPQGMDHICVHNVTYNNDLLENDRRSAKLALFRTRNAIKNGGRLNVSIVGDSITAMMLPNPIEKTVPNTAARDRVEYYFREYGGDWIESKKKYTSEEIGRASDGLGAIYSRLSATMYALGALMEKGVNISVQNYAMYGQRMQDFSDENITPWLQSVCDSFDNTCTNLAVVAFGMNDFRGMKYADRATYAIKELKKHGFEIIIVGVARRADDIENINGYKRINCAAENAANFTGSAFVRTTAYYDDDGLGKMGIVKSDICSANKIHHPGDRENRKIGLELILPLFL